MTLRQSFTALALLLTTSATACGSHSDEATADPTGGPSSSGADDAGADSGKKANVVPGTPDDNQITEDHGFFVAPTGRDSNEGTRARPFATLQHAITHAAQVGKIVFACTGTYAESIVLADSISLIGGLDCSDPMEWKNGAAPSRISAPTNPAITAKTIMSPTRLEGLDVVAPAATGPGASSIGLFADHAPGLTIANSKIAAGDGARGTDGTKAIQLVEVGSNQGKSSPTQTKCGAAVGDVCRNPITRAYREPPGGAGGTSSCNGAPGHDGIPGGAGGSGGLWIAVNQGPYVTTWAEYTVGATRFDYGQPGGAGTSADGAIGSDGAVALEIGSLTSNGYEPANGNAGQDGLPGQGGQGGMGGTGADMSTPNQAQGSVNEIDANVGGAGGGAGGCPGLAGAPGSGGGASIGIALLESPVVLDGVTVRAGAGGAGGRGTFGSDPLPGGLPGRSVTVSASGRGASGGRGGFAGTSTNGSNGPSVGILVSGASPAMKGSTMATPGSGAPAIPGLTIYSLGFPRTIPETPAGLSVAVKTL